jgi:hypothetical protein
MELMRHKSDIFLEVESWVLLAATAEYLSLRVCGVGLAALPEEAPVSICV